MAQNVQTIIVPHTIYPIDGGDHVTFFSKLSFSGHVLSEIHQELLDKLP